MSFSVAHKFFFLIIKKPRRALIWERKRKLSESEISFKLFYAMVALKYCVLKEYRLDIWLKFLIQ